MTYSETFFPMFVSNLKTTVSIPELSGQIESKICICPWWLHDFSNTLATSSCQYECYLTLPGKKKD